MESLEHADDLDSGQRRLWTPWRMQYVGGGAKESGCIFCNRIASHDDVAALILHRTSASIVIMNLFPYNTGHVMIVPNAHIDTPETTDPALLADLSGLLPSTLRALRRVLACHGFNVGMNVGSIAGAGVAEHLHQHVVPRWNGDANFMPILASAMIIPELIPVTYAKLRAELQREISPETAQRITCVVLDAAGERVLLTPAGELPEAEIDPTQPVWKTATNVASSLEIAATVAGWAGPSDTRVTEPVALTLIAAAPTSGANWHPVADLPRPLGTIVSRAVLQLAPLVRTR